MFHIQINPWNLIIPESKQRTLAMASPIPELVPVMTATLPARGLTDDCICVVLKEGRVFDGVKSGRGDFYCYLLAIVSTKKFHHAEVISKAFLGLWQLKRRKLQLLRRHL